jgi:hypothetical protein
MVKRLIFFVFLASIFWGCKEEMDFPFAKDFPVVITGDYIRINYDEVILQGEVVIPDNLINENLELEFGFFINSQWNNDTIFLGVSATSQRFQYNLEKRFISNTKVEIKAFAKNDSVFYGGNTIMVDFIGKNFTINEVIPHQGVWQDTIKIKGLRLDGHPDHTRVFFVRPWENHSQHFFEATVFAIDSNNIMVAVPGITNAVSVDIIIDIASQQLRIKNKFQIAKPDISGFFPEYGFDGDTITITGNHFGHFFNSANQSNNSVTIAGKVLPVVSWNNHKIEVVLDNLPVRVEDHITIKYLSLEGTSQKTFFFINPWRQRSDLPNSWDMNASRGFSINSFGIAGNGNTFQRYNPSANMWFSLPGIEQVYGYPSPLVINNRAFIVNATSGHGPRRYNIFEFKSGGNSGQWQNLGTTTLPDYLPWGHTSVVVQNRAFLLTGNQQDPTSANFFEIDPENNLWTPAAQFPGGLLRFSFSMEINGMAYFGTGLKDGVRSDLFYQYDLLSDTWTQMANFPIKSHTAIGFSLDGIGYAGLGNSENTGNFDRGIYSYDPHLNTWKWVATFAAPIYSWVANKNAFVFTIGNVAYIGSNRSSSNNFFEFDPAYLRENYQHETQKSKSE